MTQVYVSVLKGAPLNSKSTEKVALANMNENIHKRQFHQTIVKDGIQSR